MYREAKIRPATVLDLLPLAELAERYSVEATQMKKHPLDISAFMQNMAMSIVAPDGYVEVLVVDDEIRGAFWGCLYSMPWSTAKLAQDICFFVDGDCRGYGVSLIRNWIRWAKSQGAVEVSLSSASGIDTWRTQRLFKSLGFTKQGEAFSKEL